MRISDAWWKEQSNNTSKDDLKSLISEEWKKINKNYGNSWKLIDFILAPGYAIFDSVLIHDSINQYICHLAHKMCDVRIIVHESFA